MLYLRKSILDKIESFNQDVFVRRRSGSTESETAGRFLKVPTRHQTLRQMTNHQLDVAAQENAVKQAILAERERCAQVCEGWVSRHAFANSAQIELAQHLAAAIRCGPETGESTSPKPQPEAND